MGFQVPLNETSFNKFVNLDSIETRIVNHIKNTDTPAAQRIWKLLKYSDMKALFKSNLTAKQKQSLIYKDQDQKECRVFTFPYIEDEYDEVCSLIKVYVYGIEPQNHIISTVNIGFEILSHNKLTNVYNDDGDVLEGGRPVEETISVKNRNTIILRSLIAILNGAVVEGVGRFQLNKVLSTTDKATSGLQNNKNFYGYNLIMSCQMSGVGGAVNG